MAEPRSRGSAVVALLVSVGVEAGAIAGAVWAGSIARYRVEWAHLWRWMGAAPPEDVVIGLVRWVVLVLAGWALASTVLFALAALTHNRLLIRGARAIAAPMVRGMVERALAVSLASTVLVVARGAPVFAQTPGPVVRAAVPAATAVQSDVAPGPAQTDASATSSGTCTVQSDDNLWTIAAAQMAKATGRPVEELRSADIAPYWRLVKEANVGRLQSGDPKLVFPGEEVLLPPVATTTAVAVAVSEPTTAMASPQPKSPTEVTHVVRPGDTLSGIADAEDGDASAWPAIAERNHGVVQPDGRALEDPDLILPGWSLQVPVPGAVAPTPPIASPAIPPADATTTGPSAGTTTPDPPATPPPTIPAPPSTPPPTVPPPPATDPPAPSSAAATSTTSPPTTAPAPEPSTTSSTTPAPGPALAGGLPAPPPPSVPGSSTTSTTEPAADAVSPPPGGLPLPAAPSSLPTPPPTRSPRPTLAKPTPSTTEADRPQDITATQAAARQKTHSRLNVAPLLGAGLVALIAAGRAIQRRRRRLGERIPMPEPELAEMEQALRTRAEPSDAEALDIALRRLSAGLRDAKLSPPEIHGVELTHTEVELILAKPATPAPAGFRVREGGRRWVCSRRGLVEDPSLADEMAPLPALVTLGQTERGTLLANLEAGGVIAVGGDPEAAKAVLVAIALELATASWTDYVDVDVVGLDLGRQRSLGRARRRDSLEELHLQRRATEVDDLRRKSGFDSTLAARVAGRGASGDWMNVTVVLSDAVGPELAVAVKALVSGRGRCGQVLVVAGECRGAHWRLKALADGELAVPPLGVTVTAQRLGEAQTEAVTKLVALTRRAATAVVPSPVGEDDPAHDGPDRPEDAWEAELRVFGEPHVVRRAPGGTWERVDFERTVDQEFVAFLESRGRFGAFPDQIVTALWIEKEMESEGGHESLEGGGRRIGPISAKTLDNLVSRTRAQLGQTADGRLFLPKRENQSHPHKLDLERFGSDHRRISALVARAEMATVTPSKIALLREALSLVNGVPYDTSNHEWAAIGQRVELQQRVGDAAGAMAKLCLEAEVADPAGVRFAVAKARLVDPEADSDVLLRYEMLAAAAERDLGEVRTVVRRAKERRGPDERLDGETEALFRELTSATG